MKKFPVTIGCGLSLTGCLYFTYQKKFVGYANGKGIPSFEKEPVYPVIFANIPTELYIEFHPQPQIPQLPVTKQKIEVRHSFTRNLVYYIQFPVLSTTLCN
eukprot:TRINITY_DN16127_c0_g1_i1.p1 TRINITY_DN16127_c0_g1~~TRINITY_DN16127_c0_g1_i1.p1  ORF type:complete len:101 (+),score=11.44 TRINITY_DN16127_c0_g1_i1:457-759(+)